MLSTIETLAIKVGHQLKSRKLTMATVESCTGGGLSYWITSVPGSSAWFERGFVTYSRAAKIQSVGVNPLTLDQFGEVSEEAAIEMAAGGLHVSGADVCIAITGIAGPSGGTSAKPVGTVWIAWATRHSAIETTLNQFEGDRQHVRLRAMESALEKLLEIIE